MPLFYYFLVSFFPVSQCFWGCPAFAVLKYVTHSKSVTGGGISDVRPLVLSAVMEARARSVFIPGSTETSCASKSGELRAWEYWSLLPNEVLHMEVVCKLSRDLGVCGITLTSINTIHSFSLYRFGNWYPERQKVIFPNTLSSSPLWS